MSYPINPNIPDATHDPADDQGPMQTNFSNINMYLQVDHSDPAATNAGQHEQVTFATNNVPALPTPTFGGNNIGVLFTNTVAGGTVDQLFYYAGSSGQSSSQYTAASTGSTFLLGGMILKWGSGAISSSGTTNMFAGEFPNACFAVIICSRDGAFKDQMAVTAKSTSQFTGTRTVGSGSTGIYYIAIGY